jgi:carboxylesterase type B
MVVYWTNFAKSGNPNVPVPTQVKWTEYSSKNPAVMKLDTPISIDYTYRKTYCDFWDSMGYDYGT